MYREDERTQLLEKIVSFFKENDTFEGLLQIGSGAVGFTDIYSDIDLMAGCYDVQNLGDAERQLQNFLKVWAQCMLKSMLGQILCWDYLHFFLMV